MNGKKHAVHLKLTTSGYISHARFLAKRLKLENGFKEAQVSHSFSKGFQSVIGAIHFKL